ncbi:hypothetical protein IPC339_04020 [Pseudomonas aeruginosa]|uniref:hypothetical protein n=1 Tax=Pseudomonas aeruginosa TaxID=287 RepID=UPI000F52469E|nr:hypothetical protein [Pseudomonas aeruginosa]RQD26016.1 hypothetical protein IPC339_04020 [Pseudomonas aeruginosa]RQF03319.1 hypothetical protein IPC289_02175 [Pseudomonas aeruginosa]HCE6813306.1 hypothetical protein [Pseudomonas aeruginosa]HCG1251610.1 hypothetical protein [Pseudomonas aeruginosa]HCK4588955.1 hypothetical protein [Pseudomonas aeruginosa]
MSAEKPRERPILFNDQMVRAILEGRKTATRRIAKPVKHPDLGNIYAPGALVLEREPQHVIDRACPYGQPGDRLWVRETWGLQVRSYGGGAGEFIVYRATNPDAIYCRSSEGREYPVKWKPSIHMRRHSSRILLEITAVRVERLQDISEEQARAEGYPAERECETGGSGLDAWLWFRSLWGEINGPEAFTANPWVWVIEFKRVTP